MSERTKRTLINAVVSIITSAITAFGTCHMIDKADARPPIDNRTPARDN